MAVALRLVITQPLEGRSLSYTLRRALEILERRAVHIDAGAVTKIEGIETSAIILLHKADEAYAREILAAIGIDVQSTL